MASLTITTTAAEDLRLAPAWGAKLGLNRSATTAEVKAYLIKVLRGAVIEYEVQQAVAALPAPSAFTPT
jgi:hypothetical protein